MVGLADLSRLSRRSCARKRDLRTRKKGAGILEGVERGGWGNKRIGNRMGATNSD